MISAHITIDADIDLTDDIGEVIGRLATGIQTESRRLMDESVPSGRLYRRGRIRGRFLKGLRRVPGTKTRAFVGQRFHRASAPGQPPAKDTDALYRQIRIGGRKLNRTVTFAAPHAAYVENMRPFIDGAIRRAADKL